MTLRKNKIPKKQKYNKELFIMSMSIADWLNLQCKSIVPLNLSQNELLIVDGDDAWEETQFKQE